MPRAMLAAALLTGGRLPATAEEIGQVTTAIKILGANHRITIEAFDDPKVEGVACYISRARTGGISGSLGLAEDTSDASIDCAQTGPVKFREELEDGEEVFSRRASLVFKHIQVVRFFDKTRNALVYLTYSDKLVDGLAEEQRRGGGDPRLAVTAILYRAAGPVTLVGSGPVPRRGWPQALEIAPEALAADGGGDVALPGGARFRAVIGDMDSLRDPGRLRAAGVPLHAIAEQDSTDLEKCLCSVEAPLFVGLGFLGGRVDHQLAAMNALTRYPGHAGGAARRRATSAFLCPPALELALPAGTRVSLFPMARLRGRVSQGLRWPVDGPGLRAGRAHRHLEPGAGRAGQARLRRAGDAGDPARRALSARRLPRSPNRSTCATRKSWPTAEPGQDRP